MFPLSISARTEVKKDLMSFCNVFKAEESQKYNCWQPLDHFCSKVIKQYDKAKVSFSKIGCQGSLDSLDQQFNEPAR